MAHDRRDGFEARELRRGPAAFARDDFEVAAFEPAHDDRLHDALRLDRRGKLIERFLVHVRARLVFAALEHVERQLPQLVFLSWKAEIDTTEQRVRAASEPRLL